MTHQDNTFNPTRNFFAAQSVKPENLDEIDMRTLTPFQRILLAIDGTVTKVIEAYTMEPVEIIRLRQGEIQLPKDHEWLEVLKNTEVITREVILIGKSSRTIYVYAKSLIVPERLDDEVRRKLEVEGQGLGRILLNHRLETYREILWYGKENIIDLPDAIGNLAGTEFISRTYRIIAGGKPIFLITESFPTADIRLPAP